jgi:hypothetical protein
MKFIVLIYNDTGMHDTLPQDHADAMMRECLTNAEELKANGRLLESQMLEAPSTAKSIRVRNGRRTTVDGPFAETKEMLGGFNLIEARDMDEALEIASTFPWAETGCVEVRPVRDIETVRQRVFAESSSHAASAP